MVEIQYFALFTFLGVNFCGIYYSCDKPTPLEVHELKKVFDGIWTKVRNCRKLWAWRRGGVHLKMTGVLWYLLEVKKTDLVPLRLLSLKMSFSRSFCRTFKGNELKKLVSVSVFLENRYLLEAKSISSHAHKTGSQYLLGFFWKFPMIYMEVPSRATRLISLL